MKPALAIFLICLAWPRPCDAQPQRIVSMDLGIDEILVELADRDRIAALSRLSADEHLSNILEKAEGIPIHRGTAEEILALNPDLVLVGKYTSKATKDMLGRLNVRTLQIASPTNFDELRKNIRVLGEVLDNPAEAERMIASLDKQLESAVPAGGGDPLVTVIFQGGCAYGNETMIHSILKAAGARNLTAEVGNVGFVRLDLEELVAHKPDYFVFSNFHRGKTSLARQFLFHPALGKLVPENRHIMVHSPLINSDSTYAAAAATFLAREFSSR